VLVVADFFSGALGAIGDVAGALINSSSAQAIASKQLQQQLFLAGGGEYSSMVKNAEAAGINPLVAFGVGAGGGTPSIPVGETGTGVAAAGKDLAIALKDMDQRQALLDKTKAETANVKADTAAKGQDVARQQAAIDYLRAHPNSALPAGVSPIGATDAVTRRMLDAPPPKPPSLSPSTLPGAASVPPTISNWSEWYGNMHDRIFGVSPGRLE
jgi:hypothetical protein